MTPPSAADIATQLGLKPHPEGGYFRETYRGGRPVVTDRGLRPLATAIFFLVTSESPSRFHRLASDELWFFHAGSPLKVITLLPDGTSEAMVLAGQRDWALGESYAPQAIVRAGSWQAARLLTPPGTGRQERWTLVSCVVTPGFDYDDFELAERAELLTAYPEHAEIITALT